MLAINAPYTEGILARVKPVSFVVAVSW